jgi:hypothetical protein
MTATELIAKYVNKRAFWLVVEVWVLVETRDVRKAFGRIDVRISPVGGKGEMWVASDALNFNV